MPSANHTDIILNAARIANLQGYTGSFTELGGGELNDTFLLHCKSNDVVLRIARNPERNALAREERALKLLHDLPNVPKLIFFDQTKRIDGYLWIIEEYQPGSRIKRLSIEQFNALGSLLAKVHSIKGPEQCVSPWQAFINNCQRFGDEPYLLTHPDLQLRSYILALKDTCLDSIHTTQHSALCHRDVTPSNILAQEDNVSLIDWEFSEFGDPMSDFSTGFWSDMELNRGLWRQQLSSQERQALYDGYSAGGGDLDEKLIGLYELIDKVGVAAYLYWRLHVSDWKTRDNMESQYRLDYKSILKSLEGSLK